MKRSRIRIRFCSCLMVLSLMVVWNSPGFGGEEGTPEDPCTLLTVEETDCLFSKQIGPGRSGSVGPGIRECVWPAEGIPKFILQVLPSSLGKVRKSIDLGEGYRVVDIEGLSGEAAVAIQQANPKYGTTEGVAMLAIRAGEVTLTFSPVHLDIQEGSPEFERLRSLADKAAKRAMAK